MRYMNKLSLALVLFAFHSFPARASTDPSESHAAAVLLNNFETVFHTTPAMSSDLPADIRSGFTREPFGFLFAGLDAIGPQVRSTLLDNSDAILVGSKDYHPPLGLGRVQSTRCYIAVLRKNSAFDFSRYFKTVAMKKAAGDARVWNWSAELQEFGENDPRPSALFAVQIGQSYVLISNKLEELSLSEQLISPGDDVKIFSETRDWGDVRHHEFWGYRKYRHVRTPEKFDGTDRLTPHTQALIVFVDVKERIGVLRLLSASESDNAPRNIDATKWIPPFKAVRSGVWESAFPLDGAGEFGDSGNSVLWLFGWGVVV